VGLYVANILNYFGVSIIDKYTEMLSAAW